MKIYANKQAVKQDSQASNFVFDETLPLFLPCMWVNLALSCHRSLFNFSLGQWPKQCTFVQCVCKVDGSVMSKFSLDVIMLC